MVRERLNSLPCPALRPLQVARISHPPGAAADDGSTPFAVALRDPLGMAGEPGPQPLLLTDAEWRIAQALDGQRSVDDIARGLAIAPGPIESLLQRLSLGLALNDERFEEAADVALSEMQAQAERPPIGPGRDYPADRTELRIRVGGVIANDWDMPPAPNIHAMWAPAAAFDGATPLYARCYGALRHHAKNFERVLLLGALGAPVRSLLVPLDKPLATPLGTVPLDSAALAALAIMPGRDALAHRHALCLERHALFLRLALPDIPVLPVLVGAVPGTSTDTPPDPRTYPPLEYALSALQRVMELPGRTLILAAADLTRWIAPDQTKNDEAPAKPALRKPRGTFVYTGRLASEVRATERDCADAAAELDAERFWNAGYRGSESSRRNHLPAPYLLLRLLQTLRKQQPEFECRGSLLGYMPIQTTREFATAATMVFHG